MAKNKNIMKICLVYFFLTFVMGYLDFDRRVESFDYSVECIERVAARDFALPMVYRILVPYTLYSIKTISGIPLNYIYLIFRFFGYFLSFVLFHLYLRRWFDEKVSMIGTLSLIAALPLTLTNWYSVPTDMPELITFILAAIWILDDKYKYLLFLVPIATLNKESSLAIVMLYFLNGLGKTSFMKLTIRSSFLFLLWLIPFTFLTITFGFKTWPPFDNVIHNYSGLMRIFAHPNPYNHYYFIVYLCGFYWVLAFIGFKTKPDFLKWSVIVVALIFMYVFLRAGAINEIRIFVPFCVFIIPLGLFSLFGKNEQTNRNINHRSVL